MVTEDNRVPVRSNSEIKESCHSVSVRSHDRQEFALYSSHRTAMPAAGSGTTAAAVVSRPRATWTDSVVIRQNPAAVSVARQDTTDVERDVASRLALSDSAARRRRRVVPARSGQMTDSCSLQLVQTPSSRPLCIAFSLQITRQLPDLHAISLSAHFSRVLAVKSITDNCRPFCQHLFADINFSEQRAPDVRRRYNVCCTWRRLSLLLSE